MRHDDRIRIVHMIEAAETAIDFVSGRKRSELDSNTMLRFALVHAIGILGEAAGKVSDDQRRAAPGVPWSRIVSMRNRLIHAYFAIDNEILWKTVVDELPALLPKLRELCNDN